MQKLARHGSYGDKSSTLTSTVLVINRHQRRACLTPARGQPEARPQSLWAGPPIDQINCCAGAAPGAVHRRRAEAARVPAVPAGHRGGAAAAARGRPRRGPRAHPQVCRGQIHKLNPSARSAHSCPNTYLISHEARNWEPRGSSNSGAFTVTDSASLQPDLPAKLSCGQCRARCCAESMWVLLTKSPSTSWSFRSFASCHAGNEARGLKGPNQRGT